MNNQELLDKAAAELDYIESEDSLGTTDSADALDTLNYMMAEWAFSDKDFNWFIQDSLSDTVPLPLWAYAGVISSLAVRLGATFSTSVTPELLAKKLEAENMIGRTLINLKLDNTDMLHLPTGAGRGHRYNIETDS